MNIDRLAEKTDALIEKIRSLSYKFSPENEEDAKDEIQEAIDALERWLELAHEDNEAKEEKDEED